ncbi:low-density lipoprotein receptor-related protein 11 [Lampris incognitus]|uniref:low-density lipoprotein receptor-related protein 11 n=1 Tax=Lampris incognitus TaxID=2546036 RepID=UPI0024B563E7|nr:low-density lipoprotein receptor-related protein 11 [Lampris incognitus]
MAPNAPEGPEMLCGCVNTARLQHPRLIACLLLLCAVGPTDTRSSPISDLKSKISGVEELLEEFRKQLQQEQEYPRGGDAADACLGSFGAVGENIIRAKASIEQGATFLSAPRSSYSWKDCLHACCSEPHCTVAVVQEDLPQSENSISCYLFNCTYKNKNVCSFAPQPGFSTYHRPPNATGDVLTSSAAHGDANKMSSSIRKPEQRLEDEDDDTQEQDEPPRSDAGQDVVIQLPTDWAVLDGRGSVDDHGISHYEWALIKGDTVVNMEGTHPGLLEISGLQQGVYTFQMTVTDTAGQKSSDNVSVTVLAPEHKAEVCTGHCSRYQFMCDDGCCIDITYACDGKQHCPDRSDEAFCHNIDSSRKSVTHPAGVSGPHRVGAKMEGTEEDHMFQESPGRTIQSVVLPQAPIESQHRAKVAPLPPDHSQNPNQQEGSPSQGPCVSPPDFGPCKAAFPRWYYDRKAGACKHFLYGGCKGNHNNFLQEADCVSECMQKTATVASPTIRQIETAAPKLPGSRSQQESDVYITKPYPVKGGHPVPESGAILPLALGLIITALLLLMIGCRLKLVGRRMKKARPLTTEESDYLINGMYL